MKHKAETKNALDATKNALDATTHSQEVEEEEDEPILPVRKKQKATTNNNNNATLYLDTIDRSMLDFDFEKVCSVSLSNLNVYACLVCGKYFQGRGPSSHAYFHSVHENHHPFINLSTLKCYILPDGYQVSDSSLADIKYVLRPTYTQEAVSTLDKASSYSLDLNNKRYLPGFVGLNNIKENDYENVVVQALAHIKPLRDFFLLNDFDNAPEFTKRLGLLIRKMWNPKAFKGQVSPHEFVQEVANLSQKRFRIDAQSDPMDFLPWLLNTLHTQLGGTRKRGSSIVHRTFQGMVQVESQEFLIKEASMKFDETKAIKTQVVPFLFLTLDLPSAPLFIDEVERNIIPQVPVTQLLSKFDGVTSTETAKELRRYKIVELPRFLIFHIKRFQKNVYTVEKNVTVVNFPVKMLNMSPYTQTPNIPAMYDLVANITYESSLSSTGELSAPATEISALGGNYKIQLYSKGLDKWFTIQDLMISETQKEMLVLGESYIQVWERRDIQL